MFSPSQCSGWPCRWATQMMPLAGRFVRPATRSGHVSSIRVHAGSRPAATICTRPRVRSTTSSSTGSSTTTHTQWCDQDTGDTSSAVNATITTATASSPRRCASPASARPATLIDRAVSTHITVAPAVSPGLRSAKPCNDWFATNSGPVAAVTRDESRNRPFSQNAVDSRGRDHPPGERHHGERAGRHGCRAEAAGQQQVHHEDTGDELAGRRDADADPLEPVPVG